MKLGMFGSRFAVLCALGATVSGCAEYMDRKDTIAFNAGEAVETNVVTHVTDPWPAHAQNKDIAFNGQRAAANVQAYRCRKPKGDEGGNANSNASRGGFAFSMTVNNNGGGGGDAKSGDGC